MTLKPPRAPFLIVLCVALWLFCMTPSARPPGSPQRPDLPIPATTAPGPSFADRIMASVALISTDAGWQGSGSHIGGGLILSAGHIVKGASSFTITFENDPCTYTSTTFYLESAADIGFIYLENYNGPSLTFSTTPPRRGDVVFIFGNSFGNQFSYSITRGIISHTARDVDGRFGSKLLLQSDAHGFPGCSGGPVVNDQGEILGIVVGGPPRACGSISLIIPAKICQQSMTTYLSILEMEKLK